MVWHIWGSELAIYHSDHERCPLLHNYHPRMMSLCQLTLKFFSPSCIFFRFLFFFLRQTLCFRAHLCNTINSIATDLLMVTHVRSLKILSLSQSENRSVIKLFLKKNNTNTPAICAEWHSKLSHKSNRWDMSFIILIQDLDWDIVMANKPCYSLLTAKYFFSESILFLSIFL